MQQRFVWPGAQSVTFDIVSRCFENENNNCCEIKICINAICLLFTNLQIHFWLLCGLDMTAGWPDCGFVNFWLVNNWHFFKFKLLFLFLKHLDTMSNVTDCDPGQTDLWCGPCTGSQVPRPWVLESLKITFTVEAKKL